MESSVSFGLALRRKKINPPWYSFRLEVPLPDRHPDLLQSAIPN